MSSKRSRARTHGLPPIDSREVAVERASEAIEFFDRQARLLDDDRVERAHRDVSAPVDVHGGEATGTG